MSVIDTSRIRKNLSRCRSLPVKVIIKKVLSRIRRLANEMHRKRKDFNIKTYACTSKITHLNSFFKPIPIEYLLPHAKNIAIICQKYLRHEFDLLGSGWIRISHGMRCPGIEGVRYHNKKKVIRDLQGNWLHGRINRSNESYARSVWYAVDQDYIPVDWHLDFKSGFRWDEATWYKNIVYGIQAGADVKVPWELSRMQHLSQFALAFSLSSSGHAEFKKKIEYQKEFENQILDFIASNPPRFGVNWNSTMDVSIRAVNWLVAYDLFKKHGAVFGREFEKIFFNSIYDHGVHIAENIEYSPELRGNHYLSNIAGLLYVSAYLPNSAETDTWLAFSIIEIMLEYESQFNRDGSNFEGSTSYHRLSTEICIYSIALIKNIASDCFERILSNSRELYLTFVEKNGYDLAEFKNRCIKFQFEKCIKVFEERFEKNIQFAIDMLGPCAQNVQIGDNDSGRFLKLQPVYESLNAGEAYQEFYNLEKLQSENNALYYFAENHLDHRHLISAANGLLGQNSFKVNGHKEFYEESIVRNLACAKYEIDSKIVDNAAKCNNNKNIQNSKGLLDKLGKTAYPEFGVYVYKSLNLYLVIRCGPLGQNGFGGHAHNDQLSIVLAINNHFIFIDPGSYLYTNFPEKRNQFRSTIMHNTLVHPKIEQNDFVDNTLFALIEKTNTKLMKFEQTEFAAVHNGYTMPHVRKIRIEENRLCIIDECNIENSFLNLNLHYGIDIEIENGRKVAWLKSDRQLIKIGISDGCFTLVDSSYSGAYGWIRSTKSLRVSEFVGCMKWYLEVAA